MCAVLCAGAVFVASVAWGQPSPPTEPEPWTTPGTEASSPTPSAAPAVTACDPSDECRRFGLCTTHDGQCYAASDEECRRSEGCREGRCTAVQGRCVISASADCRQSVGCRDEGRCSLRADRCVVASDADCGQTTACRVYRACVARQGRCVFGSGPTPLAPVPAAPEEDTKPRSLLVYRTGVGFTIAGSALAIMGAALMTNDDARIWSAAIVAPTAGVLVVSGIPLWALGGSSIPSATEPQSDGATIGGIILTTFGLGGSIVSGVFAAAGTKMALLPLGLSFGAMGGGVALATYGAEEVPLGTARALPNVQLGPGSLDLTWSF
ncbi:MAG: hypothetical protein JRI68_08290 [Deltaproteobacteria bacterium]|nr:hypothetical protein [Deltaproteobacteria bacterium]